MSDTKEHRGNGFLIKSPREVSWYQQEFAFFHFKSSETIN